MIQSIMHTLGPLLQFQDATLALVVAHVICITGTITTSSNGVQYHL